MGERKEGEEERREGRHLILCSCPDIVLFHLFIYYLHLYSFSQPIFIECLPNEGLCGA